jgi:hypothetical protein
VDKTWIVVIAGALFGLIGVVYQLTRSAQVKTDEKVEAVKDDVGDLKQDIAQLKTRVEHLEIEVHGLRKRFHDSVDSAKKLMWELYQEFMAEVRRMIGK